MNNNNKNTIFNCKPVISTIFFFVNFGVPYSYEKGRQTRHVKIVYHESGKENIETHT